MAVRHTSKACYHGAIDSGCRLIIDDMSSLLRGAVSARWRPWGDARELASWVRCLAVCREKATTPLSSAAGQEHSSAHGCPLIAGGFKDLIDCARRYSRQNNRQQQAVPCLQVVQAKLTPAPSCRSRCNALHLMGLTMGQ